MALANAREINTLANQIDLYDQEAIADEVTIAIEDILAGHNYSTRAMLALILSLVDSEVTRRLQE